MNPNRPNPNENDPLLSEKVLTKKNLPSLKIHLGNFDERVKHLMANMENCLSKNERINLSVPPHVESTVALHHIVYEEGQIGKLRIEYNDGSLAKPFPVHTLWEPKGGWEKWCPKNGQHLCIGTLSLRHVDYDPFVDFYLLRDKETRRLNQGDIDKLAYDEMSKLLNAEELHGEFYLTIFQAGLEPLAVGLYRALVEHLQHRNKSGFGPMRVASIFGLNKGKVPEPWLIWGSRGSQQ